MLTCSSVDRGHYADRSTSGTDRSSLNDTYLRRTGGTTTIAMPIRLPRRRPTAPRILLGGMMPNMRPGSNVLVV